MNEMNLNAEQQPTTPTPEENGGQGSKLFTQDEVNRIVSERLARERAKPEPTPEDAREADLRARETRLSCREYIAEEGFPAELLEVLDTSDFDKFKAVVEQLDKIANLPSRKRKPIPRFVAPMGHGGKPSNPQKELLEEAFKPPKI